MVVYGHFKGRKMAKRGWHNVYTIRTQHVHNPYAQYTEIDQYTGRGIEVVRRLLGLIQRVIGMSPDLQIYNDLHIG